MSSNGSSRNPVQDTLALLFRDQLEVAGHLCEPEFEFDDDSLDGLVDSVMSKMALGQTQKQIRQVFTCWLDTPHQHGVFSHLVSWLFATRGALTTQYQPLLAAPTNSNPARCSNESEQLQLPSQSHLFRLPNEVLDMILHYLPSEDTNDLRLTCREARARTFPFWSETFFSTRQFMVDEYSLRTLVDISCHPQLSTALTHLIIDVNEIISVDILNYIRDRYAKNPDRIPTEFQYWRAAVSAQQALLNTGRAINLLSTAMSNLPRLSTVSLSGSKLFSEDYHGPPEIQYAHSGMHSYGSSAYQMHIGYEGDGTQDSKGFLDRVFNVILNSLAVSASRVNALRTNLSGGEGKLKQLDDEAFNLPPHALFDTSGATVLGGLSELHLDVSLQSKLLYSVDIVTEHQHSFDPCNIGLRQVIALASNLQSLTLNAWDCVAPESHCDFMAWLAEPAGHLLGAVVEDDDKAESDSPTPIHWTPPPVELPSLQSLVLKGFYISPGQLRAVFKKFNGLKSAALHKVRLRKCAVDDPPVPAHSDDMENLWASFLRRSSAILANLDSLELDHLGVMQFREDPDGDVCVTDKDVDSILFGPGESSAEPPPSSRTVTDFGKDALKKLAGETLLRRDWNRAPDPAETDDSS